MPLFSTCFIIFTLGNIGLPATSSFIGEFLIILGCFETNSWAALLTGTGLIWGACYGLWLQNRILFGNIKSYSMKKFQDLNRFELYLLTPFVILTFLLGLFPDLVISYITIY